MLHIVKDIINKHTITENGVIGNIGNDAIYDHQQQVRNRALRYFWMIGVFIVIFYTLYDNEMDFSYIENNNGSDDIHINQESLTFQENVIKENHKGLEKMKSFDKNVIPQVVLSGDIMFASDRFKDINSTDNVYDPSAILLIKIPKVGGTTLSVTLERFCKVSGLRVAHPGTFSLRTCRSQAKSLETWESMIKHNGGKIDAWVTHSW